MYMKEQRDRKSPAISEEPLAGDLLHQTPRLTTKSQESPCWCEYRKDISRAEERPEKSMGGKRDASLTKLALRVSGERMAWSVNCTGTIFPPNGKR